MRSIPSDQRISTGRTRVVRLTATDRVLSLVLLSFLSVACQGVCPEGAEYVGEINKEVLCRRGAIRHGIHKKWHKNGQLIVERAYQEGRLHGVHREWYSNGSPKIEINYNEGLYEGSYKRWYTNGQLELEGSYKQHRRSGLYREWYRNGNPRLEQTHNGNGGFEGTQRFWRSNGHPRHELVYENGKLIGQKFWRHNGSPEAVYVPR